MLNSMRRSLLSQPHLMSISAMWHPLGTRPRRSLFQHSIDLFQRKTLGLRDKEVRINQTQDTERAPKEENLRSKIHSAT
jgi:hypothetical protein